MIIFLKFFRTEPIGCVSHLCVCVCVTACFLQFVFPKIQLFQWIGKGWGTIHVSQKTVSQMFQLFPVSAVLNIYLGCGPLPVTVTTRIITFSVGDPYKPSFTTGILGGAHPHPRYTSFRYFLLTIKLMHVDGSIPTI